MEQRKRRSRQTNDNVLGEKCRQLQLCRCGRVGEKQAKQAHSAEGVFKVSDAFVDGLDRERKREQ